MAKDVLAADDALIAAAAPVKRDICAEEILKPHSPGTAAMLASYCAHIPTNVLTALEADFTAIRAGVEADHP